MDLADRLDDWQKAGDPRVWKVVVSPENGARLDLRAHTRALVSEMEADLGTRLEWAAIDHHDTDHPHVHVVVRGLREDGSLLRLPREYLTQGIRMRSQQLATQALGLRTEHDRRRARERAIRAEHFTTLDGILEQRVDEARGVDLGTTPPSRSAQALRRQLLGRLAFLTEVGLATNRGHGTWTLRDELGPALSALRQARDIQQSLAAGRLALSDPAAPKQIGGPAPGETVRGRFAGAVALDEGARRFWVIERTDGRLQLVPEDGSLARHREAGRVTRGVIVTLQGHETRRGRWTELMRHGRLAVMERHADPVTPLDRAAIRRLRGAVAEDGSEFRGFARAWWRAASRRFAILERSGLARRVGDDGTEGRRRWVLVQGAEETVEARIRERGRVPITLEEARRLAATPLRRAPAEPHRVLRGRLVAYAVDEAGETYAILDIGRQAMAVPTTRRDLAVGARLRARSREIGEGEGASRRRALVWQLDDFDRERARLRERTR